MLRAVFWVGQLLTNLAVNTPTKKTGFDPIVKIRKINKIIPIQKKLNCIFRRAKILTQIMGGKENGKSKI